MSTENEGIGTVCATTAISAGLAYMTQSYLAIDPLNAAIYTFAANAFNYYYASTIKTEILTEEGLGSRFANITSYILPSIVLAISGTCAFETNVKLFLLCDLANTLFLMLYGKKDSRQENLPEEGHFNFERTCCETALMLGIAFAGQTVFHINPLHSAAYYLATKIITIGGYHLKEYMMTNEIGTADRHWKNSPFDVITYHLLEKGPFIAVILTNLCSTQMAINLYVIQTLGVTAMDVLTGQ